MYEKIFMSLPVRLVIGVAIGIGLGVAANETWMNLVVTVQYVLNQLIVFCVPLIILGFIAPAITQLGQKRYQAARTGCNDCLSVLCWCRFIFNGGRL